MTYLDYNATTPVAPEVREAMLPFLEEQYGNPSSGHRLGQAAHEAVERARRQVAELVGGEPEEIVFTSGGTEANNLALKGVFLHGASGARGHLVISAIEHPATVAPARFLERLGVRVSVVPCDEQGVVRVEDVARQLRDDTRLISIMHANNEVGSVQPIAEIAALARQRDILLHTDAAQSAGKISCRAAELGADLLSLAGHKMYAPKGVGALLVRQGVTLEPLLHGAGHERGQRAGTENVPQLAGFGAAARLAREALTRRVPGVERLRDQLQQRLAADVPGLIVHARQAPRLPNTLSVALPDVEAAELLRQVPELCASTGSACHSGARHVSPTLAAMGVAPERAAGTIRLSLGWNTTADEVQQAADQLVAAWRQLAHVSRKQR